MKNKNGIKKYWENEQGETIEFGHSFMRYYGDAGKLQFGIKYFNSQNGEINYNVKFTLDKKDLCESKEGLPYLRETLDEWKEDMEHEDD